jgi:hypothetical protein
MRAWALFESSLAASAAGGFEDCAGPRRTPPGRMHGVPMLNSGTQINPAARAANRTVDRVVRVLQIVRSGEPIRICEISRRSCIPYATSHRIVTSLVAGKLLKREGAGPVRFADR